jgi:lipoate-protein ligase B
MARTDIAPTNILATGVVDTLAAANVDGHAISNNGLTWIEVANGAGAPINVTIQTQMTVHGLAVADQVVAVTNGTRKKIGPFDKDAYNVQSGADAGKIYVDFSSVTTITVGAFRIG